MSAKAAAASPRLEVRKTYKLFIGGGFPRSESGRTYEVHASDGRFLANAALGSRKDGRDAVLAARTAQPGWAGATAYNRGQVLYRVAELLEGRRGQFVDEVRSGEGLSAADAEAVSRANNTPYGLSAGVWTEKGSRILWMADRLRAGVVWANTFNRFDTTSPFGGYKESGCGREGGMHGLHAYVRLEDR